MKIPSGKTEKRAINVLESLIDEHGTMDYSFNEDDKEMAWDGYIFLFKEDNGDQSKKNYEARISVQIKGHDDSDGKYVNREKITYKVCVDDLKIYATEMGVLYFQIFTNLKKSTIFYATLYPSKIASILDNVDTKSKNRGKEAQESVNIPFFRLEKTPRSLYRVAKQFYKEASQQGTAVSPLVMDRIRLSEFDKVKEVDLSVYDAETPIDVLKAFATGDICLYGKTGEDKYLRPVEWTKGLILSFDNVVEQPITIGKNKFYDSYHVYVDSEDDFKITFSKNLSFDRKSGKFVFNPISSIKEIGNDAKFMSELRSYSYFSVSNQKLFFSNMELDEERMDKLCFYSDLYDVSEMIGFDINTLLSSLSPDDVNQFIKLIKIKKGYYKDTFKDEYSKYYWKIENRDFPLLVIKEESGYKLVNAIYTRNYEIYLPGDENGGKGSRMPLFIYQGADTLSNLYIYDFDEFKRQIDRSQINEHSTDVINNYGILNLINAYDKCKDERFLSLAEYMLEKIKPFFSEECFILNFLQIRQRRGKLTDKDIKVLGAISNDDTGVSFGKYVLLKNKEMANLLFEKLTKEEQELYKRYPIYYLYKQL